MSHLFSYVFYCQRQTPCSQSIDTLHRNLVAKLLLQLCIHISSIYISQQLSCAHNSLNVPFISVSPSASTLRLTAYPNFRSSFLAFLALILALGPLLGNSPGRAPRAASALEILFFASSLRCRRPFFAVAARAASRFLDGPFGFLTDGIFDEALFSAEQGLVN